MSRLISCHWCGRFHSSNEICNKKPKVDYKQKREKIYQRLTKEKMSFIQVADGRDLEILL